MSQDSESTNKEQSQEQTSNETLYITNGRVTYWHGFYGPDAFPAAPKEKSPIILELERRIAIVEKYGGIKKLISEIQKPDVQDELIHERRSDALDENGPTVTKP